MKELFDQCEDGFEKFLVVLCVIGGGLLLGFLAGACFLM